MNKVKKLRRKMNRIRQQVLAIQDACDHPGSRRTYLLRWNTGNYDPMANCKWVDYTCRDCKRSWQVDGHGGLVGKEKKS